jgi:hypothetical protein
MLEILHKKPQGTLRGRLNIYTYLATGTEEGRLKLRKGS